MIMGKSLARVLTTASVVVFLATPAVAQLATPNESGLTYGHVHLNVTDIEAHTRLWVEHFGGVAVRKGSLTAVRFPNFLVALSEQKPTGGSRGSVMNHFGFKVRSTPKFLEKWRATGLPAFDVFIGAEGHRNAFVMMPDEVYVEVQEDQALPVEVSGYHLHFHTPDFEALLDWYVDVFSLEKRPRGRISTTTNVPGMNLSFGNADAPATPTRGRAIDHIGFEIDDLESFCRMLEAKGIEFDVPYREVEGLQLKIAILTDPSGTSVELTEGFDSY